MKGDINCLHKVENQTERSCIKCGAYYHKASGVYGIKTSNYTDDSMAHSESQFNRLRLSNKNFKQIEPLELNPIVTNFLDQLMKDFGLSLLTFVRSQYMFYHLMSEKPHLQYQQLRYGVACLYLAAKMTQTYRKIPNLRQFGRHACRVFEPYQYLALEEEILSYSINFIFEVNFFIDFLEHYQIKGVVLSNEMDVDLEEIQTKIQTAAYNYIKNADFINYPQQRLAASILHQVRRECNVQEIWNQHIQFYTKIGTLDIYNILKETRKKVVGDINPAKRLVAKNGSTSSASSKCSTSSSSSIVVSCGPVIRVSNPNPTSNPNRSGSACRTIKADSTLRRITIRS